MSQFYQKGSRVWVFNTTMGGTVFIEGEAVILRRVAGHSNYLVSFNGGQPQPVQRYVDVAGQDDPVAYVNKLNDQS